MRRGLIPPALDSSRACIIASSPLRDVGVAVLGDSWRLHSVVFHSIVEAACSKHFGVTWTSVRLTATNTDVVSVRTYATTSPSP